MPVQTTVTSNIYRPCLLARGESHFSFLSPAPLEGTYPTSTHHLPAPNETRLESFAIVAHHAWTHSLDARQQSELDAASVQQHITNIGDGAKAQTPIHTEYRHMAELPITASEAGQALLTSSTSTSSNDSLFISRVEESHR